MTELKRTTPAAGQANGGAIEMVRSNYTTAEQKVTSATPAYPYYQKITDTAPAKTLCLAELVALAEDGPTIGPKNQAAALTPFCANGKTQPVAVQSLFYALVTDHDDDDKSAEEIAATYDPWNVAYFAYTSASHEQEKHGIKAKRWKPIIPLAYPVDFERYNVLSRGLMLMNGTDAVQSRSQQVFYAPNIVAKGAPFDFIDATERPFVDPFDDSHPLVKAAVEAYETETQRQEAEASKATPKPRPVKLTESDAGIIDKVKEAYHGAEAAILSEHDYRRIRGRYLSPHSSTGTPGVVILDNSRVYSHHGASDPLSSLNHDGHALDVFDLLCALRFGGDFSQAVAELAKEVDPEGQKQRQRDWAAAKGREQLIEQFGTAVTAEAEELAEQIHGELLTRLQIDPDEEPEEAESLKPDGERITRMIHGAFWSGSSGKLFLLNHAESLIRFTEKDAFKFLARTFGNVVERAAVEALAKRLSFGCEKPEAEENARAKFVAGCMAVAKGAIIDYLKYHNQRESIEWRVDMFGKFSRLELLEDRARIVLTHKPFPEQPKPQDYARIIGDYKEHFPRFDEFLTFVVMSRFALDRKKSYLWILAGSDWGKGFLTGVLKHMGACVETSMKEVEAMLEGKAVGRSAEDFKRAMVLLIDEFKTVKSELKQLQSEITLSPKHQLSCTVEVFAKVFTSAESVGSLVTENGVEDQFANRMSIFQEAGDITRRPVYQEAGDARYFRAVVAYTTHFLNSKIAEVQRMGREPAERMAGEWLNGFIRRNGLDTVYERFSDTLPGLAQEITDYLNEQFHDARVVKDGPHTYLTSPAKAIDDYLTEHYDHSQIAAFRKKKDELLKLMSEDGKGAATYRVKGRPKKAVKLKV